MSGAANDQEGKQPKRSLKLSVLLGNPYLTGLRDRIQAARSTLGKYAQTYPVVLSLTTMLVTLALTGTPMGTYLEGPLFQDPAFNLKAKLGLQPHVPNEIRTVMADDATLKYLGRPPTFSEWLAVSEKLFGLGFERALLQEPQDLKTTIGAPVRPRPSAGYLAVSVLDAPGSKSIRVIKSGDIPERFGIHAGGGVSAFSLSESMLGPIPETLDFIDGLGTNNVDVLSTRLVPLGVRTKDGRIFPHIGLLADKNLRFDNDGLRGSRGPIPVQTDGKVFVDFVALGSVVKSAVPMRLFFENTAEGPRIVQHLRDDLIAKLKGGRIAMLLPAAYSGSRYTFSPVEGAVPAYLNILSVATSALSGHFVYAPLPLWLVVWAALPIWYWLLMRRRTRHALTSAGGGLVVLCGGSLVTFIWGGFVFPAASLGIVGVTGIIVKSLHHLLITVGEKSKLANELVLGSVVQKLLLPAVRSGEIGAWEYQIFYRPHLVMSGDWFQIQSILDGRGVIALGDVAGKGASAALITATCAGVWHAEAKYWEDGDIDIIRFLTAMNESISRSFQGQQNSTLSLAVLAPTTIRVYRAGAPKWLHLKSTGPAKQINSKPLSAALGMIIDTIADNGVDVTPEVNDVFIAYSDGVMDSMIYTRAFLNDLGKLDRTSGKAIFDEIIKLAEANNAFEGIEDDLTIAIVRYVGT